MSSHHIVRDDQEPALLILHLDQNNHSIIHSLLGWSPIVIANYQTAEQLITLDIKVDWVLINENQQEEIEDLMLYQHPYQLKVKQSEDDIKEALDWLIEKGHNAVNIIGHQFDEHTLDLILHQKDLETIVLFDKNFKGLISKKNIFEKWMRKDQHLKTSAISYHNTLEKEGELVVLEDGMIQLEANPPYYIFEKWN